MEIKYEDGCGGGAAAACSVGRSGGSKTHYSCGWPFRPLAVTVGPGRAVGPMASTEMKKAENSYSQEATAMDDI
jgi:hypothetical protein